MRFDLCYPYMGGGGGGGKRWEVMKLYTGALFVINGLGHTTWSSMMPVSRSRTISY